MNASRPLDPAISRIVRHAAAIDFADLPETTVRATQRALIDTVGAGAAGTSTPMGRMVAEMASDTGGRPDSTLWGSRQRVPLAEAAFTNAIIGRCRELDDVHEGSPQIGLGHGGHVSVMVVPAVFAAAEAMPFPVSGAEVIAAIAVGSDLIPRLRMAAGRSRRIGWEGPTLAPFGVAAAIGRLWGFDETTMANAMGAAYSQCSGNVQATIDGAWDIWLNAGLGARGGVVAAELARRGHQGTGEPLLGAMGLYQLYFRGEYLEDGLLTGLGETFEGENLSVKMYSSCKYTHNAIYTATGLAQSNNISPADIKQIRVRTNSHEMRVVVKDAAGRHKYEPDSVGAAQFSLPFVIAVGLLRGSVFPDTLDESMLRNPEILALARKVVVEIDPRKEELLASQGYPPDDVEIQTHDGQTISGMNEYTKGHPGNPTVFEEIVEKFERCCSLAEQPPGANARSQFLERVRTLPNSEDCRTIVSDLFADRYLL